MSRVIPGLRLGRSRGDADRLADVPVVDLEAASDLVIVWRFDASAEVVWRHLTESERLELWLGRLVEGAVVEGEEFVIDHGGGVFCRSEAMTVDEPASLAFTWNFPDEPRSDVSITLKHGPGATAVELRHRGLDDLVESYADGWSVHLTFLEAATLGVPLPFEMFWPLHATIARMRAVTASRGEG